MEPQVLADYDTICGENPLWHPAEKRLYWTDIPTGRLFWYDPASGEHAQCLEGHTVGGFTLNRDGSLLLFMDRGRVATWRDGQFGRDVITELEDEVHTRFNDVIADPEGRVFCGTMPVPDKAPGGGRPGRLYRLDPDGSIHKLLEGIGVANGMGFTLDLARFYFTDSKPRTIWQFEYDRATGAITNQRPFVCTEGTPDVPDGMTVDSTGDIWSARFGGGCVIHYDAAGQEVGRLAVPATNVTSVAFGGDRLDELYITTAKAGVKEKTGENRHAGALLRARPGVTGIEEFRSAFDF